MLSHNSECQWNTLDDVKTPQWTAVRHLRRHRFTSMTSSKTGGMTENQSRKQHGTPGMTASHPRNWQCDIWQMSQPPQWVLIEHVEWHKTTLVSSRWTPETMQCNLREWHWTLKWNKSISVRGSGASRKMQIHIREGQWYDKNDTHLPQGVAWNTWNNRE